MTLEERKKFMLSVVKNKGRCRPGLNYGINCEDICALTEKAGCCFSQKGAYKVAVAWAAENCKEDLLEQLI